MKTILTVCGSLRKQSLNRQLMNMLTEELKGNFAVNELNFQDIPLFNQDIEFPVPDEVEKARNQVLAADLLLIVAPEYNHQIPGGLKNLFDWLSRPLIKNRYDLGTGMKGKSAVIAGVSGKSATGFARPLLKDLLLYGGMEVLGGEGLGIAATLKERQADILSLKAEDRARLKDFVKVIKESI